MSNVYSSGDYAGMSAGKYSFYFGYEETACDNHAGEDCSNCEWAFVATKDGLEVARIPQSKLGLRGKEPIEYLLAGIAVLLSTHP